MGFPGKWNDPHLNQWNPSISSKTYGPVLSQIWPQHLPPRHSHPAGSRRIPADAAGFLVSQARAPMAWLSSTGRAERF